LFTLFTEGLAFAPKKRLDGGVMLPSQASVLVVDHGVGAACDYEAGFTEVEPTSRQAGPNFTDSGQPRDGPRTGRRRSRRNAGTSRRVGAPSPTLHGLADARVVGDPDEPVARSQTAGTMMHIDFVTLATEAESDDAIDDEGEVVGGRDRAGRQPANTQPPTAP
jgi:hypothetical protein